MKIGSVLIGLPIRKIFLVFFTAKYYVYEKLEFDLLLK